MACSVFCSRVPSVIDTGFRTKNRPTTCLHPSSERSSAALWHGDHPHKYSRGILAWRRGHLSTLWHVDPQQNHFWGRVAWQDCLEPVSNRSIDDASAGFRHGIPGGRPLVGIPAWLRGFSDRSLARPPCPQVPQWHPRVAKGTSIDPLARGPSTEPLLGQGHVARLSGTGVKPVSCRSPGRTSARHPRPQVP